MMHPFYLSEKSVSQFIKAALHEDIGDGDHTSLGAIPANLKSKARLLIKADGIMAGVELAEKLFHHCNKDLKVTFYKKDGDHIVRGEVAFEVEGKARSILAAERIVLNCMQRMSGIATLTHTLCTLLAGTKARLMDTRKTTPNFRLAEKWAVLIGGGLNHRFALYDMVMLKDNHVDMAGGIEKAIGNVKKYLHQKKKNLRIEIETRTLQEVEEVIKVGGVDVIMLDNMSLEDMKQAVKIVDGRYLLEASGGITERTLRGVAECGVDFISVGALTHSAKSLDLSLKVVD